MPDIKEVIDMMVAAGKTDADIISVIEKYNAKQAKARAIEQAKLAEQQRLREEGTDDPSAPNAGGSWGRANQETGEVVSNIDINDPDLPPGYYFYDDGEERFAEDGSPIRFDFQYDGEDRSGFDLIYNKESVTKEKERIRKEEIFEEEKYDAMVAAGDNWTENAEQKWLRENYPEKAEKTNSEIVSQTRNNADGYHFRSGEAETIKFLKKDFGKNSKFYKETGLEFSFSHGFTGGSGKFSYDDDYIIVTAPNGKEKKFETDFDRESGKGLKQWNDFKKWAAENAYKDEGMTTKTGNKVNVSDATKMNEEDFIKEFNHSGAIITSSEDAVPGFSAVTVKLPGAGPNGTTKELKISLQPWTHSGEMEARDQILELQAYQNKTKKNKNAPLLEALTTDDEALYYTTGDFGQLSNEQINAMKSANITVSKTGKTQGVDVDSFWNVSLDGKRDAVEYTFKQNGKNVYTGTVYGFRDFVASGNISLKPEEIDALKTKILGYENEIKKSAKNISDKKIAALTKDDVLDNYYDKKLITDIVANSNIPEDDLNNALQDYFMQITKAGKRPTISDKKKRIADFSATDFLEYYHGWLTIRATSTGGTGEYAISGDMYEAPTETKEEFVRKYNADLEKSWSSIYKEPVVDEEGNIISQGLDVTLANHRLTMNDNIRKSDIRAELENDTGLRTIVSSSRLMQRQDLEEKTKQQEELVKSYTRKLENEKFKIEYELNSIVDSAQKEGVTSVKYIDNGNGVDGYYLVEAQDENIRKKYQAKFDNALKRSRAISSQWEEERKNLVLESDELDALLNEFQGDEYVTKASSMEYNLREVLAQDVMHSFENLFLDVPVLFGSDSALRRKNNNIQSSQLYLPDKGTYSDAWDEGNFGTYALRTVAQQSAPVVTAIAGSYGATAILGATRGATIATNAIPAFYGVTAAGGKRGEIETANERAIQATKDIEILEKNKDLIDPDVYKESMAALRAVEADGNVNGWKKWLTIVGSGIIEGTVTRYLGTLPNSLKLVKDFTSPLDDIIMAGARNGWQNAGHAALRLGGRTLSEVAEEVTIAGGTMGLEALTLGKDFEWDTLDDVAIDAIMVAGPMNGTGVMYSSVLQHYASRPMFEKNMSIKRELQRNKDELGKTNDKRKRAMLMEEREGLINQMYALSSEMELMAMQNGGKRNADLMRVGNELRELDKQAGVDPTLSPDSKEKMLADYITKLESENPSKAKKFKEQYDSALKFKEKLLSNIDFDTVIEEVYGPEGARIKARLIKQNPSLKKLDNKEIAIAVHEEFKRQNQQKIVQATRTAYDGKILEAVEKQVYNGKTFKESGRKNRNRKAEDEILAVYGQQLGIQSTNTGIIINRDQSINARSVLSDKRLQDIQSVQATTDEQLQETLLQFQDNILAQEIERINRSKLTEDQKRDEIDKIQADINQESEMLLDELRMGETNAVILRNGKYIVRDKKAADAALKDGNLLAGTALSHEIMHAIDQKVFDGLGDMTSYAVNLFDYMQKNIPEVHQNALNLQRAIGNFNPDVSMAEQSSLFWDEYTKSVQDFLSRPKYSADVRRILQRGQSTRNKLRAMFGGDYKINNSTDAAVYLAGYIDAFKRGELGDFQKRKIDALAKKEKKAKLKEARKSANIKSPILYKQANALGKKVNDLYATKDSNPDFAFDIAKLYEPMLGRYLTRIEDKGAILGKQDETGRVSQDERSKNITDFKMNGMYGERGIVDLIDKFNPDEMVDVVDPSTGETVQEANTLSRYLNGTFPQRISEFTKNTTIDFQGFKVDMSKAENVLTTETEDSTNDILTPEVQDQLNTPFLNNIELTKEQVKAAREIITSVVGRKLPALDANVSKNKSVSPLIAALKKEFGIKNGPLHRMIQSVIGSSKAEVEAYLKSPRNKNAILQTLTTTWLSRNLPMAVEKYVNGIGYTTDHVGRKKGTKDGDIRAWKASEEGPYKGMTDGKQKIRRNPNANKDVSNAMLLSNFAKGDKMTDIRRAGLEKLELALAQEFGMEIFKADMINDGPLKELFVGRQDLFNRVLADNFVEEFVRQTERGVTKRSKNPSFFTPINADDKNALAVVEAEGYSLIADIIKNFDKKREFGGADAVLGLYPIETIEWFLDAGGFDLFDSNVENGFVVPTKGMSWGIFDKQKQVYLNNGTQSKVMKDAMRDVGSSMIDILPPQVLKGLSKEFFGLVSSRLLDGAVKKDGSVGPYYDLRVKFEQAQAKPNTKVKLPFDPTKLELLNSSSGLMKSISNILNKDISRAEKLEQLKKLQPRIDAANANNKLFLKYFFSEAAKMLVKNPQNAVGLASLLQGATNNVKGFRAFTDLGMIKVLDGPQAPFVKPNGTYTTVKPNETNGHKVNKKHPDYKRAMKEANNNEKVAGDILGYKGEHIDPSANVMQKLLRSTFELAELINNNPTKAEKAIMEHQKKFDNILLNFDQSLGTKVDSDLQDARLTSTSNIGYFRNIVIESELKNYINAKNGETVQNLVKEKGMAMLNMAPIEEVLKAERIDDAVTMARRSSNPSKGITILDFDDTLATSKSEVISTSPDGVVRKLTAEEFANEGAELLEQGWKHDFSEFNKVIGGKVARLFNKALKLQSKFGPENMFVLTARPPASQNSIFEFLKANGLNIPLKNITGLGNSTSEAKALWVADKVAEGYNDFYFADDALQNVQAVQNMLDQFDVKSKVQQAKRSVDPSKVFNDIIEMTTGVESEKQFSDAQAKIRGHKTKYKSIIPASAQDFMGLLYNFIGKGKVGETQMQFLKEKLVDPFARGINDLNSSKQTSANDYKNLLKQFPDVKKKLNKKIEGTEFNNDQAVRVYLWNRAGFEVPGLSKRDLNMLTSVVNNDSQLKSFAEGVGAISKKENGYSQPGDFWLAENITSDLLSDGAIGDARSEHLAEWIENKNIIFSQENMNKIEAIYGSKFREALEDMLYRMETGRNRPMGGGRLMNMYMNWVNNSVGAIMFFNMRSALLQTISAINFVNWSDNNPAKAAAAFANQPQYWKDFAFLFNSDYLKQRRSGNQRGINEAELSAAVAGAENKAKAAIAWLLKKGFLPTQLADSFAIAAGGATFYRNRIKKYLKEGMTQEQAEKQAFLDFQETSEVAQQSARPDMISQQQASPLGRLILSFQNTPMQYARIINKAARDLANGRGDFKTHVSKIVYYGVAQGILFGALQSALFAAIGDEEEEEYDKKKERILNQMLDSLLSGIGYGGKAISTVKNTIQEYMKQQSKEWGADHTYTILSLLGFSPPIGSKLRKIYSSIQTQKYNKGVSEKRGFTLDNPTWNVIGNVIEGFTNIPLGRLANKMLNIDNALDSNHEWWQRAALLLGWNTWDLGIKDPDIIQAKEEVKEEKREKKKQENKIKKEKKKQEKERENQAEINKNKSKNDGRCAAINRHGKRCKNKAVNGGFCTIHEKKEKRSDGVKLQCKKIKSDGKRCKMKTSNKSGLCYYHD